MAHSDFDPETALTVGLILAPVGLRGELKVEPLTDFPERFEPGSLLYVDAQPLRVERSRRLRRSVIVKLEGIEDRNRAEALRGAELQARPLEQGLGEDTYYRDDLIGLDVVDEGGAALGTLADILSTGSNDVYVVRGEKGEILLPATDDVVKTVSLEQKRMVVEVVEGLEWRGPRKPDDRNKTGRKRPAKAAEAGQK